MKVKVSQFREMVREALMEVLATEDHTAHSQESGYSHGVEEAVEAEGVDQSNRKAMGYTDEPADYDVIGLKEAPVGTQDPNLKPKSATSSSALHTRDKSQMQGVGPRPDMQKAFEPIGQKKEAMVGATDPNKPQTGSASASSALHTRDKSKMQGVGPRPTMQNAFGDQPQKKEGLMEKAKLFIKTNKPMYKKQHGAMWKEALMAATQKELGK